MSPLLKSTFQAQAALRLVSLSAVVAAAFALIPVAGHAQSTSGLTAKLLVQNGGSTSPTEIDLTSWINFNPGSGQLSLVAPGTPLAGSNWKWVTETVTVPGSTETQQTTASKTFLRWKDESLATISVLDVAGNIDPFMTYSFAVKNNTAVDQTYTFVFGEALSPTITGQYTLIADLGLSLSTTTPTATITPVGAKLQTLKLSTDGGITSFNAGVDVGNALSRNTNGTSIAYESSSLLTLTTGMVLNYWEFETTFTLTPSGDAVGLSGFAEIIPIPEPSTYALLAGCTVFGLVALRRMKRAVGAIA